MSDLATYFTEEAIVRLLCKYRAKHSHKRHKLHMMRDISLTDGTNKIKEAKFNKEFKFLNSHFPTRNNWVKLNERERKTYKDSVTRNIEQLYKTYRFYKKRNLLPDQQDLWYRNLLAFVAEIQSTVNNITSYSFVKPRLTGILKKEGSVKNGILNEYRPITIYGLHDRIITSITARYMIDFFDNYFYNCSFAFRSSQDKNNIYNHHKCIQRINTYRESKESLWVAECDIQKFFDTVNHKHLKNILLEHCNILHSKENKSIDPLALQVFDKFLESFAFNKDVYTKNGDDGWWAKSHLKPKSEFKWVEEGLTSTYGKEYLSQRIGVPQGNALSCFVANLLMHNIDSKVLESDSNLLYVRFCDDMVVIHPDKKSCERALENYKNELIENYLIFHSPVKCSGYLEKKACKDFWKSKSKEPYHWNNPYKNSEAIPWLSFVGYQIKYSGEVRIRKQSIIKEKKKHVKEVQLVLKAIDHDKGNLNSSSRLSKNQIVCSLHTRLISMSVGRIKFHNYKSKNQGLCWTNGFEMIREENHMYIKRQLRGLDNFREKQIWRLDQELKSLGKPSHNPELYKESYFGSPYSYHNYIVKHK